MTIKNLTEKSNEIFLAVKSLYGSEEIREDLSKKKQVYESLKENIESLKELMISENLNNETFLWLNELNNLVQRLLTESIDIFYKY